MTTDRSYGRVTICGPPIRQDGGGGVLIDPYRPSGLFDPLAGWPRHSEILIPAHCRKPPMADADAEPEGDEPADEADEGIDDLVARVAVEDEGLAAEVGEVVDRVATLEAELADREERIEALEGKLKRARADFQNYKKRAEKRENELRERATEDLVERLLDVRDNLRRALEQEGDEADIRDGVEATLASFDRVLSDENVEAIEPSVGDEVDPEVHEVVMRVDGEQPPGHIEEVYRAGYELAGKVIRPAQVTVAEE